MRASSRLVGLSGNAFLKVLFPHEGPSLFSPPYSICQPTFSRAHTEVSAIEVDFVHNIWGVFINSFSEVEKATVLREF